MAFLNARHRSVLHEFNNKKNGSDSGEAELNHLADDGDTAINSETVHGTP